MKKLIINSILLLLVIPAFAQEGNKDLPIEGVEVIKNFDARLKDAVKVDINPEIPPINEDVHKYKYKVSDVDLAISYPPPVIRPISMRREKLPTSYNGYLKAGLGTPSLLLVDGAYQFVDKEQVGFGISGFYNSAKKGDFQKYTDTDLKAFGELKLNRQAHVEASIRYDIDDLNFYGFRPNGNDVIQESDIDRKYRLFELNGAYTNTSQDRQSEMTLHLNPYRLSLSDLKSHENGIGIKGNFERQLNSDIYLSTEAQLGWASYKTDVKTLALFDYSLLPSIRISKEKYSARLGANLASAEGDYFAFPVISASFNIAKDKFILFAGSDGGYHANSIRNIYEYSPYISATPDTMLYSKTLQFYGGMKGQLKLLSYYGEAGFKKVDDHALYLTDHSDFRNPLDVIYDDLNIFYVQGSVALLIHKNFKVSTTLTQNFYNPKLQLEAWHLPNMELTAGLDYNLFNNKLNLNSELYFGSSVRYLDRDGNEARLNNLVDLNIGATYTVFNRLKAFTQFNNVLDNKYERWNQYRSFGLGIMGGLIILI